MRLIDADALIEHLREYKTVYGVPMTDSDKQVVHCIIGHIKNLEPTAYDVETVVAELEKRCDIFKTGMFSMEMHDRDNAFNEGVYKGYEGALRVVRNGGKE